MNRQSTTHTLQQKPTVTPAAGGLLQRKCACGNHTMAGGECEECSKTKRLGLQTKLKVNEPGDIYEQEADRIADQVTAIPAHHAVSGAPPRIQRLAGQPTGQADTAPTSVESTLASPGRPLEPALRQDMEQRFDHDFSRVRVHTGGAAERSAREVSAHAYTIGHNMVFGAGRFAPGTYEGRRLIAHELVHVIQQSVTGDGDKRIMRKGFESTINICHRVLESRKFEVTKGGLRVVLILKNLDKNIPNCRDFDFGVTLTRSEDWWPDNEIGTCETSTGGTRSFSFANLSAGTYYLTIWRNFDHPYCCLEGDILVFDEAVSNDSTGCKRDKDLSAMDIVHGALDIAGFIPVLGAIPDGVNAIIYVAEGDWVNAGVSVVAMIPAIGDGAKAAVMGGKAAVKISEKTALKLGEEGLAKAFKEAKAASKVEKATLETTEEAAKAAKQLEKEAAEKTTGKLEKEAAEKAEREAAEKKKKEKKKSKKCSDALIATLNAALHTFCDKPRRCSMQGDTCESATAKVAAGYGCVDGRTTLQQKCFSPGDPGYENHMIQIAQANAALRNCIAVMTAKCK